MNLVSLQVPHYYHIFDSFPNSIHNLMGNPMDNPSCNKELGYGTISFSTNIEAKHDIIIRFNGMLVEKLGLSKETLAMYLL